MVTPVMRRRSRARPERGVARMPSSWFDRIPFSTPTDTWEHHDQRATASWYRDALSPQSTSGLRVEAAHGDAEQTAAQLFPMTAPVLYPVQ